MLGVLARVVLEIFGILLTGSRQRNSTCEHMQGADGDLLLPPVDLQDKIQSTRRSELDSLR